MNIADTIVSMSRRAARPSGAFVSIVLGVVAVGRGQNARFVAMHPLPAGYVFVGRTTTVTNDGIVIGSLIDSTVTHYEAYLWDGATGFTMLGVPKGELWSVPGHANSTGSFIPGSAGNNEHAIPLVWIDFKGPYMLPGFPPDVDAQMWGVALDGSILSGYMFGSPAQGFLWHEQTGLELLGVPPGSTFSSSGQLSDRGDVMLSAVSAIGGGQEGARWTRVGGWKRLGDLPGGSVDAAMDACSADGRVGVGFGNDGIRQMIRWDQHHGIIKLPSTVPNQIGGVCRSVSGTGWRAVGRGAMLSVGNRAMIWDPIGGTRLLQDVLEQEYGLDLGEWILIDAQAISDNGRFIAGRMGKLSGEQAGFLVEIPAFCYADCNADKTLDIFDYLCFTQEFNKQSVYANCNNDGSMNIFDYICFGNKFAEGCEQ